jgi:hypothetical protein
VVWTRLVDGPWVNSPHLRRMPLTFYIYGLVLHQYIIFYTIVASYELRIIRY